MAGCLPKKSKNSPSETYNKKLILNRTLIPFFGSKKIDEIESYDIDRLKERESRRGMSPKTINNALTILRKCLVTARQWKLTKQLPTIEFCKYTPPAIKWLSAAEAERLLGACTTELRPMVLVALRAGLRFSELVALEWRDVDFENGILHVDRAWVRNQTKAPKNGKGRGVPMSSDLIEELSSLPRRSKLVLTDGKGRRRSYYAWRCRLRKACERAGLEPIGWHALRHSFASQLVTRSVSLRAIKDLLGHTDLDMTLRYAKFAAKELSHVVELLVPEHRNPKKVGTIWATSPPAAHPRRQNHRDAMLISAPK